MLIWPVVGYIESSAGRDMAPYATSSWTNATRSRFRQRKGKVSKLIFITFDQTMIFREREREGEREREKERDVLLKCQLQSSDKFSSISSRF